MKKILLYIFAIPIGLLASIILSAIYSNVLKYFIPFESISSFLEKYLITILCGWIAVGVTAICAPSKRILFAGIMVALNVFTSYWLYTKGDDFNYLFVIGGFLCFFYILINKDKLTESNN